MSKQSTINAHREGAEIYTGRDVCKQKSNALHDELHVPRGLIPLKDLEEVGYNRATGFVWFRQKKAVTHKFRKLGRVTSFATEVTAFVEDRRMYKLTGVKTRDVMMWFTLTEFFVDKKDPEKITFKSAVGVSRTFPVSAFEEEEEEEEDGNEEGKEVV